MAERITLENDPSESTIGPENEDSKYLGSIAHEGAATQRYYL